MFSDLQDSNVALISETSSHPRNKSNKKKKMSFVDILPPELTEVVFSYLSVPDLVNSSLVCVAWYEASNMSRVWRAAIERSKPKDRFKILSNLDRFTGIASNYDDNNRFQVDRQSPSNLSIMNPWKLSLCQNNFVRRNWSGSHNTVLARHQIDFEDDMRIILDMSVEYASKLPQDRLHLPILVLRGVHSVQPVIDFLLIRLDGTPRISQKILSSMSKIRICCIDKECVVWLQDGLVRYLSLVDNKDRSQIENLGGLISGSGSEIEDFPQHRIMTMNDKYIVAGFRETFVNIWCKRTKQLIFTHKTTHTITNINSVITACYLHDERIYFKHCAESCKNDCNRSFLEIYDIKEEQSLGNTFPSLHINSIAFNDKYYAIHSALGDFREISLREIDSNEIKISVNIENDYSTFSCDPCRVWIFDGEALYIEQAELKILSLVDWSISDGIQVLIGNFPHYHIWDSFTLAQEGNIVIIWDWKQERQLHELLLDINLGPQLDIIMGFYNDETRLVAFRDKCINVIGFW